MSFSYCNFVKFPITFLVSFGLINRDFIFRPIYHFSDNWFNCIISCRGLNQVHIQPCHYFSELGSTQDYMLRNEENQLYWISGVK